MKKSYEKQHKQILIFIILFLYSSINANETDSLKIPPNSYSIIPALNFKDTDIRDIFRGIALEYETNIMLDNQIDRRVSVALFKICVFDAIKMIAEDNDLEFAFDENRFFVRTKVIVPPKPPEPPKLPEPIVKYDKIQDVMDVILKEAEIGEFVTKLREATGKNFLLSNGTSGKISGELNKVKFNIGIKNLLQNNGFYFTEKDSIFYITRSSYFSSLDPNMNNGNSPYWVSAVNKKITLDVSSASLDKILDDITYQLNLQMIKLIKPEANVTIKCREVPIESAMYYLFKGTEFTFKLENGTYIIGKKDVKNLDNVKLVKLQHIRADELLKNLPKNLFQSVTVNISIEHNGLVLMGSNDDIYSMIDYIKSIDQPVPQVMIEALVVDYNLDDLFELGVTLGRGDSSKLMQQDSWFPGINSTAGGNRINKFLTDVASLKIFGLDLDIGNLGKLPGDFFANIKMLEENGIANIKSRPLLSTLNGHTASLKIGTTQNYIFNEIMPITNQLSSTFLEKESLQKIEAFISFEITPWVGPDNQLTVEIKPDFQTPSGEFSPDKNKIPSINTRTLESTVRLKDGETIVLGGLIQETENTTISKVPLLGDIPLLGELFTYRSKQSGKSELMIYLTPHIFYGDEFGVEYIKYGMN
ncbi:MAG: hypothetical protein WAR79_00205 [Melioribacteraceae bacterium]